MGALSPNGEWRIPKGVGPATFVRHSEFGGLSQGKITSERREWQSPTEVGPSTSNRSLEFGDGRRSLCMVFCDLRIPNGFVVLFK